MTTLFSDEELRFWMWQKEFVEFGQVVDPVFEEGWCPHVEVDLKPFKKQKVIALELWRAWKSTSRHDYSNEILRKLKHALIHVFSTDAQQIILRLRPVWGDEVSTRDKKRKTTSWHFEPWKTQPDFYELFSSKKWMEIYPGLPEHENYRKKIFLGALSLVFKAIDGVWNVACLREGRATMSKMDFSRFNEILSNFVAEFVDSKGSQTVKAASIGLDLTESDLAAQIQAEAEADPHNFMGANPSRWVKARPQNREEYLEMRALDFRDHYNKFVLPLQVRSCLEEFIKQTHYSLANRLVEEKRLIFCSNKRCRKLATYFKGKRFCSKERDGQDCRQRAYQRNRYRKKVGV